MHPLVIVLILIPLIPLDIAFEPIAIVESVSTTYNELSIVGTLFYSEYAPMLVNY